MTGEVEVSQTRIDALSVMAEAQPDEPMIWYGLASEFAKLEKWQEVADATRRVVSLNADYTAAYQLLGTALLNIGRAPEARGAWTEGIEAAARTGAWKARQHMESLLAGVEYSRDESGSCAE
jgi:predicted Zn-dependent protease